MIQNEGFVYKNFTGKWLNYHVGKSVGMTVALPRVMIKLTLDEEIACNCVIQTRGNSNIHYNYKATMSILQHMTNISDLENTQSWSNVSENTPCSHALSDDNKMPKWFVNLVQLITK